MKLTPSLLQEVLTHGLLILYLLFPFQFQILKLLLLLLIISVGIGYKNIYISKKCIFWNIIFVLFNGTYLLLGYIKNNPGTDYYVATYVLWPILFMLWSGTIDPCSVHRYIRTIKICILGIILLGIISFLFFNVTLQPEGSLANFSAAIRPGFPFIAIQSPVITDFLFWFFFIFVLIFTQAKNITFKQIVFIVLGIIFIFSTSRRVLYLNFILAIFLIAIIQKHIPTNKKKVYKRVFFSLIGVVLLLSFSIALLISYGLMETSSMFDFFEKTAEASDAARMQQTKVLVEGWMVNPLLGAATGIDAELSRSEIPGTYELSYLAKLFEVGFIGIIFYIALWCLLFYWTYRTSSSNYINRRYIIAILCAMIIFLVANSTNPYLNAFDYLWFIYTPFVVINLVDKYKKSYVHS